MPIVARLAWQAAGWGSPQASAFAAGTLPPGLAPRGITAIDAALARPGIAPDFLAALSAEMPVARRGAWEALRAPGARAVVTGQQPGCAGGALLVLYKAATAIELARRIGARSARPVVPIFWNATDDEDFEEIARIAWPAGARGLEFLELPRAARRAAAWVGDLPAAGDRDAVLHMEATLDAGRRDALRRVAPDGAADHGEWVGELLARVFPELAILDARSAALRRHGAPLFARFLAARTEAASRLRAAGMRVRDAGFEPALGATAADGALYLTPERHRQKLGDDFEPLAAAVRAQPEHVSPGVVLRALLQDTLLPSVSQIVGPAELAYLIELRDLRALLGVPEPALVLRASCTLLPEAGWTAAAGLGIGAAELLQNPEQALQRIAGERAPQVALTAAFAGLEAALAALGLEAGVRDRAGRRLAAIRDDLGGELVARARADLFAARPELAPLPSLVRPRGKLQERSVAGLWALASWGERGRTMLLELAGAHLDALAAGQGEHLVVRLH